MKESVKLCRFKTSLEGLLQFLFITTEVILIEKSISWVRPPTFYQKCRDQLWYINQLETTQRQYMSLNTDLKERLTIELSRNQLPPGSSSDVDRDGQQSQDQENARAKIVHASIAMVTGSDSFAKSTRQEESEDSSSSSSSSSSCSEDEDGQKGGHLEEVPISGENDIDEESMSLENNIEQGASWSSGDTNRKSEVCYRHSGDMSHLGPSDDMSPLLVGTHPPPVQGPLDTTD
ncbi:hypothetical protein BSL78_11460 [Apostichopus japonicus]|uniref:Uncharacterized protein n=1 Tax=Stichopus japonicus TaxID=307972 RepID=A0A2G8KUQ0_STIJA|nr:hypothetical protein BSL78_11460 [Apostichopus japonicus]